MVKVHYWLSGPNSAGGVNASIRLQNTSGKVIKYYWAFFTPYNAVGDAQYCTIRRESERIGKATGPVNLGEEDSGTWENLWYNHSIASIKLNKIEIEYMDGTTEVILGENVEKLDTTSSGGCYVATAVYGSYDCPQVWTLRRFRDYTLAETWYGRAFIRTYYAISPTLVKWFGETEWFKKLWKGKLDKMVSRLNENGVEDTPYEDKKW